MMGKGRSTFTRVSRLLDTEVDVHRTEWCRITSMNDAVARYRAASENNDIDGLMAVLAPDVEFVSPISGRMVFRGLDDMRIILEAVYDSLTDLRWREEVSDGSLSVVIGDARVGRVKLGDAMVFELDDLGRIRRIRPHLRPWLALTLLTIRLGPALSRHPGVLKRALQHVS